MNHQIALELTQKINDFFELELSGKQMAQMTQLIINFHKEKEKCNCPRCNILSADKYYIE